MGMTKALPTTLLEAVKYFSNPANCREYMVSRRWPNGVTCPVCGSKTVYFDSSRNGWECKTRHPKRKFTLKTGTIFEDSPLGLDKWLPCVWLIANCKNGVSSWEIHRALGVTQKTAWFMLHRIRLAQQGQHGPFSGDVEADETFVGGRARYMHKDRKERMLKGRQSGTFGKVAVLGMLERNTPTRRSRVKLEVVPNIRRWKLQAELRKHVEMGKGTTLYTDALKSYMAKTPQGWRPVDYYIHKVIDHAERYVDGQIHTNGCENFWSLLKRTLKGTYVSVEPFHLFRYLDEQAFRFNEREGNDWDRFQTVMSGIIGRRVTYKQLTGEGDRAESL
jgi:transposase-like protein